MTMMILNDDRNCQPESGGMILGDLEHENEGSDGER